jgi:hypothetical protein
MEAICSSETSIDTLRTTRRYIPDDGTPHGLRSFLMRTKPERDQQQTAHYVCSIPCECDGSYVVGTGRPLGRAALGIWAKCQLAQHPYEGHRVGWDEARVLEIGSNGRYRKQKESAHMARSANLISQPSLYISPILIPLLSVKRLATYTEGRYDLTDSNSN